MATIQPRKRFGQHFLHDPAIIQRIISAFAPQPGEAIVEIGPGLGALTQSLLALSQRLDVIELDQDLLPRLRQLGLGVGELIIHQADVLRFDFSRFTSHAHTLRVIGNLPYNISTPLLFHLMEQRYLIKDMVFMLQKEVVDRIVALPGNKAYGRLSVMLQYYCQTEFLFMVKPGAFNPPPQVDSAIIRLQPYQQLPNVAQDEQRFAEIVRLAFNQRRKTLTNSLRSLINKEQLIAVNIDPQQRAEQLSVADYVRLANVSE